MNSALNRSPLPKSLMWGISFLVTLFALDAQAVDPMVDSSEKTKTPTIEVFTSTAYPVPSTVSVNYPSKPSTVVHYYVIDHIDRLQRVLSEGLSAEPKQAKQQVLDRFQALSQSHTKSLENTAKGLAQALHYGVDRYPAVVIDGEFLLYGMSDVTEAMNYYRQWCEERELC